MSISIYLVKIRLNVGVSRIIDEATQGAIHSIINVVNHHSFRAVLLTI